MSTNNIRYKILLIIFVLALICSLIISFVPLPLICTPLEGCNAVQTSVYAKTLGIDNSYYGIIIFSLMVYVSILHLKKPTKHTKIVIHIGMFIGTLIVIYFLYLQQFVIHTYCKYCLVIDVGVIIGFIVLNIPEKGRIIKNNSLYRK